MIELLEEFFQFVKYENWRPLILISGVAFIGLTSGYYFEKIWNFISQKELESQAETLPKKTTEEEKGKIIAGVTVVIVVVIFLVIIIQQIDR
ncbi:MAG: hypothetical protein N4A38_00630 [Candidatus Gracilibacteria bacterium]|jgi:p-aminobenzoyl-glutamate transporter AbgT|nr:hypothetical protein [Candidatus Gracilibacteria bacterium]